MAIPINTEKLLKGKVVESERIEYKTHSMSQVKAQVTTQVTMLFVPNPLVSNQDQFL